MADTVAFSIPVRNEPPGRAKQKLVELLESIQGARLQLKALSWFSYGRRGGTCRRWLSPAPISMQ